jgi:hypothetical protein
LTDCGGGGGGGGERAEGEEETFHKLSLNRSLGREELAGLGWDGGGGDVNWGSCKAASCEHVIWGGERGKSLDDMEQDLTEDVDFICGLVCYGYGAAPLSAIRPAQELLAKLS